MITAEDLENWLKTPSEDENLEFKEAKNDFNEDKLLAYCVALANEGGGFLVLGVTNKPPREVVGSQAFTPLNKLNEIKLKVFDKFGFRLESTELQHPNGRVLVFEVPSRPMGQPYALDGKYLMRAGESLVPMTPDQLKRIFAEDQQKWFFQNALVGLSDDEVIALLDTQKYFELIKIPYPTNRDGVLERLSKKKFIRKASSGWSVSNLGAIVLAKNLEDFALARKAIRVILYSGRNKLETQEEKTFLQGYAIAFESLVDFVHALAPRNKIIEEVRRTEVKMFPKQALRELIANAMIHQDFSITGMSVLVELYTDRVEISNPGTPVIQVDRFIDENRSRNEPLADMMRELSICEEKGSGVDKVIFWSEYYQLPAPAFWVGETKTTAILFAHQEFSAMNKPDRVRACYQHCCLLYVSNEKMSNQTLRQRFGLDESKNVLVSQIIGMAKDENKIKSDESGSGSTRYARYVPYWA